MNKKKFYITTPIYYPNAKPHIGTLYTTVLADVFARWQKLMRADVFFLTGTDEHGQKIQEAASAQNVQPKAFVDSIIPAFKQAWNRYEIDYNKFIRTTDHEHEKCVQSIFSQFIKQGDVYKSTYTGFYCVGCEAFVSLTGDALKDENGAYVCLIHKKPLQEQSEEGYFFRLSAYQEALLKFYEEHPDFITPKERLQEVISFVKSGLKDLSISRRRVSWGIPFPGDESYTIYVWADALVNYLSGVGYGQENAQDDAFFAKMWPADVHLMAKDIVRFHAIHWPAFLMALDLPLPKKLVVHGYILMGDQKMSKSLGNALDPEQLADWYGVEAVRYYLMRQMAITQDGRFDLKDLEERIGADLANNMGNLLNRMLTLAANHGLQEVQTPSTLESSSAALKEKCDETFRFYWEEMNKYSVHLALAQAWRFLSEINAYFHAQQPWTLANRNKELFAEVIASTCHSLYAIGLMAWPIMPKKMEELLAAVGHKVDLTIDYERELRENAWNKKFVLSKPSGQLFSKPESHLEAVAVPPQTVTPVAPEITIDDVAKVQLVVGTIVSCKPVEGSDKLYKLQVECGKFGQRQILSGVAQHLKSEELVGKQGVFILNLKPRKMLGLESQGMMLFAQDDAGTLRPVTVSEAVKDGAGVR
ncbi:MAG: methionine--tRNA ligase [Candidatus Babeliales bacterium]|jgi:methionyl-tRNA synthetase